MALTSHAKILGELCTAFLRERLQPDSPVKRLAEILGQSRQTAARLYLGDVPTSVQLLALAEHFGRDFIVRIFEPFVGAMSEASTVATLSRVEDLLTTLQTTRHLDMAGIGHVALSPSEPTSVNVPLSNINRFKGLKRQLEEYRDRSGSLELGEAIALARSDPNGQTVVNVQKRNDVVRCEYKARSSCVHGDDDCIGMPISDIADRKYAALSVLTAKQAIATNDPVLARVTGPVTRRDKRRIWTDIIVLRTVDRSRNGDAILTSKYIRVSDLEHSRRSSH